MFFNNMFLPPSFPIRKNYFPIPKNDFDSSENNFKNEKKDLKVNNLSYSQNNTRKEKKLPFDKIFSFLDLELDDLLILGILFFLYMEKCDDLLLYGVLFLLLFDIELDSFFKFL